MIAPPPAPTAPPIPAPMAAPLPPPARAPMPAPIAAPPPAPMSAPVPAWVAQAEANNARTAASGTRMRVMGAPGLVFIRYSEKWERQVLHDGEPDVPDG